MTVLHRPKRHEPRRADHARRADGAPAGAPPAPPLRDRGRAGRLLLARIDSGLARALVGWNVLVWLYLVWVGVALAGADSGHIKRLALAQAESARSRWRSSSRRRS
jgi:hypothetical protein